MRDHGKAKGEAYRLVKGKGKVQSDPMTYKGDQSAFPKDRDSISMGEGMNADFPTSPRQDRYKPASPFRVKAAQKAMGK